MQLSGASYFGLLAHSERQQSGVHLNCKLQSEQGTMDSARKTTPPRTDAAWLRSCTPVDGAGGAAVGAALCRRGA